MFFCSTAIHAANNLPLQQNSTGTPQSQAQPSQPFISTSTSTKVRFS